MSPSQDPRELRRLDQDRVCGQLEALPLMHFARLLGIIGQDRAVDIANKLRDWGQVQPRRRQPTPVI
jgi:hypothetical protein